METKDFKFRLDDLDEEKGIFTGLASVYDVVDSYNDIVEKGAFRKTLKDNEGKFPMCWFHNVQEPLGIVLAQDKKLGLECEGHLNLDVQSAREKRSLMKQGAIKGLSIGYQTLKEAWDGDLRKLREIKLYEISPITLNFQACPGAEIGNVKNGSLPEEFKPYPNESSARLKDPDLFDPDTYRRTKDGTIYGKIKVPETAAVIWGKLKEHNEPSDNPIPQAIRFPIKDWTADEAKKWLKDNNVKYEKFEPAEKSIEGILERVISIEEIENLSEESKILIEKSIIGLNALLSAREPSLKDTPGLDLEKPQLENEPEIYHSLLILNKQLKKLTTSIGGI